MGCVLFCRALLCAAAAAPTGARFQFPAGAPVVGTSYFLKTTARHISHMGHTVITIQLAVMISALGNMRKANDGLTNRTRTGTMM